MKAYNSPTDELHIKSNSGEELVKITPNETTIKNMDLSSLGIESTPEEVDAAVKKAEDTTATADEINSGIEKANKLPSITSSDEGKGLLVDNEGNLILSDNIKNNVLGVNNTGIITEQDDIFETIKAVNGSGVLTTYVRQIEVHIFGEEKYHFVREASGNYGDDNYILEYLGYNHSSGQLVVRNDTTQEFYTRCIVALSIIEMGTLIQNGTITLPPPSTGKFLMEYSFLNAVTLNGFTLNNKNGNTFNGILYNPDFAQFGVTTPVYCECSYNTSTGITITFTPIT